MEIEQFWRELKQEHNTTFQLRDKAASCAHGLDNVLPALRPQTCLGIEQSKRKKKLGDLTEQSQNQFSCPVETLQLNELKHHHHGDEKHTIMPVQQNIQSNNNSDIGVPLNKCQELSNNSTIINDNELEIIGSIKPHCPKDDEKFDKSPINTDILSSIITNKTDNSCLENKCDEYQDTDNKNMNIKMPQVHETSQSINSNDEPFEIILETNLDNEKSKFIDNNNDEFITHEICNLSRESSQEKSESTSSYLDPIVNSSAEADNSINFDKVQPTIIPEQFAKVPMEQIIGEIDCVVDTKENLGQKMPVKKIKTKIRQTPPEPPPRKYFTKPSPLNLNANNILSDLPDKPKVPERPDFKVNNTKRTNSETLVPVDQRECYEGYRDFIEKSMDFIDEPNVKSSINHSGYSEISEKHIKDDKPIFDKYELFTEKFGSTNSITTIQNSPELPIPTADSPDGAGCSRPAELKVRTLEKDKHYERGVVNRAMMVARSIGLHSGSKVSSASPRSNRKRNMILAKRRNVSVKDIRPGDLEGWLTYRSRGAGGAWARSWFILKGSSLYRFKNQDSIKSDCLIVLPGFTASQATEVKSRKYAFKVYHTGTVFYFAADTEDCLSLWLDSINKATLGADTHNRTSGLFSETDESDNDSKTKIKSLSSYDYKDKTFGSLKKLGRKNSGAKEQETGGASLDRKYLRFLGARTQNLPVPTAQFRSYRRVLPSSTPNRYV